jgi:hypothetical protein
MTSARQISREMEYEPVCVAKTLLMFEINGLHRQLDVADGIAAACYSQFVIDIPGAILAAFAVYFRSRLDLSLAMLALRQQIAVLKRKRRRPVLNRLDRLFWIMLRSVAAMVGCPGHREPATVIAWHRTGFRLYIGAGDPGSAAVDLGLPKRSKSHSQDEAGECRLGSAEETRGAAKAWFQGLRTHGRQVSATPAAPNREA